MTDLKPFLKNLISSPGLSGHEGPVRAIIAEAWKPLTDELSVSRVGSLHGLLRGSGPEPRDSILLAAHMDAIGLMATGVKDGFIYLTSIGGVDPRVLPGQPVTVFGDEEIPGIIQMVPVRLLPAKYKEDAIPLEYMVVDTGLPAEEVALKVRPGSLVSFANQPLDTGGDTLAGHSLDNRTSVAAVTYCLEELQRRVHTWDVWAVATTQEEETFSGAFTSAYQLQPSLAVAIDVTFASSPGTPAHKSYPMGEAVELALGPNIHPGLHKMLKQIADEIELPYKIETTTANSGTDAVGIQVSRAGIPSAVVSIPLRYMHTPVEMISLKDVRRAGRLLAEFISRLDNDTMNKLTWED